MAFEAISYLEWSNKNDWLNPNLSGCTDWVLARKATLKLMNTIYIPLKAITHVHN